MIYFTLILLAIGLVFIIREYRLIEGDYEEGLFLTKFVWYVALCIMFVNLALRYDSNERNADCHLKKETKVNCVKNNSYEKAIRNAVIGNK